MWLIFRPIKLFMNVCFTDSDRSTLKQQKLQLFPLKTWYLNRLYLGRSPALSVARKSEPMSIHMSFSGYFQPVPGRAGPQLALRPMWARPPAVPSISVGETSWQAAPSDSSFKLHLISILSSEWAVKTFHFLLCSRLRLSKTKYNAWFLSQVCYLVVWVWCGIIVICS